MIICERRAIGQPMALLNKHFVGIVKGADGLSGIIQRNPKPDER